MTIHTQFDSVADSHAFIMSAQTLAKALSAIKGGIERRSTLPILSSVRMTSDGHSLTLTTTNLTHELSHRIGLDGLPTFDICAPFAELLQLAKAKAKAAILIDTQSVFSVDGIRFETLSASDFPVMVAKPELARIKLNGSSLKPLFSAISTEVTRYYLRGLYVHGVRSGQHEQGQAVFVATDGHRLARMESGIAWPEGLPTNHGQEFGCIIPRDFVKIMIAQGEGELIFSDDQVTFVSGQSISRTRLIDGSFPDYQRVIPLYNDTQAMVDKNLLVQGLKVLDAISDQKDPCARFTFEGQALTLSHAGKGHLIENAPHDGEYFDCGFKIRYVLDLCEAHKGETLSFAFNDPSTPARIDCENLTFILMPVRV